MSRTPRIIVLGVSALAAVALLCAAGLFYFVNSKGFQARLETAISQALGLELSGGGRLGITVYPSLLVTMDDVHVRNKGTELASAKQARIWVDARSLLQQQARVSKIVLSHAIVSIERGSDGRFTFENAQGAQETLPAIDWPIFSATDAAFVYVDKRSGPAGRFEATNCSVDVNRLLLAGGKGANLMESLSFTAQLACAQARQNGFSVSDLKVSAAAANGIYVLDPVAVRVFGTPGTGTVRANLSGAVPLLQLHFSLPQFPIEEFLATMSRKKVAMGHVDFSADLELRGQTAKDLRQTAKGTISLTGRNFTLLGGDLDRQLSQFDKSQHFNLVDVGAFFFAGPLGVVVTKGFNFASVLQGQEGRSEIRTLVSKWQVDHGVARAQDVALATKENRIALRGGLDFVNDRFDDVTVALVDDQGCALVRQAIHGTFEHPVVEQPNLLQSLAGPALGVLKKARDLLFGRKCEAFYTGSVSAPK